MQGKPYRRVSGVSVLKVQFIAVNRSDKSGVLVAKGLGFSWEMHQSAEILTLTNIISNGSVGANWLKQKDKNTTL